MIMRLKKFGQGGSKYFTNRNPEDAEIVEALGSLKVAKQKEAMKQIIA